MNILDIAIAKKLAGGGGGSGTDNYNDLSNLPKINDTTLSGNKSSSALGLQSEINSDSKLASDLVDDTNQDNKFVTSTEKNTWNGKQNAIDADHKINADYVDDSTSTNKFVTASDKETWNAKQNAIDNSHKLSSDLVDDTNHTNKFVTSTEKQTWNAKQNAIDADHKLSSSLVSFSTAEAAALASGIDSSKVGQISTNQTNILLVGKQIDAITNALSASDFTWTLGKVISSYGVIVDDAPYGAITDAINIDSATAITAPTFNYQDNPVKCNVVQYNANNEMVGVRADASGDVVELLDTATYFRISFQFISTSGITVTQEIINSVFKCNLLYSTENTANAVAELVDKGAKNIFDANTTAIGSNNGGSISISGNAITVTGGSPWAKGYIGFIVEPDKDYTIRFTVTSNDSSNVYIMIGQSQTSAIYSKILSDGQTGSFEGTFHSPANTTKLHLYISVNNTSASVSPDKTIVLTDVMVTTKAKYDISPTYEPFALPNYDLTVLEAEDRAALAEVVDSGAKNLFNPTSDFSSTADITIVKNSDGTYKATSVSQSSSNVTIYADFKLDKAGVYVFSGCPSGGSDSTYRLDLRNNSGDYIAAEYGTGSTPLTLSAGTYKMGIRCAANYTTPAAGLTYKPMICTKAAFDISPAFVPYRKNLDELEATKAPALVLGSGVSSGSLDDVTKPTFDLYLDAVSNLPTIAAYYVETSVWDSQSMIQRAYNVENAESYIRVKSMDTWSAWKQITNA